jgi:hypothetical protein
MVDEMVGGEWFFDSEISSIRPLESITIMAMNEGLGIGLRQNHVNLHWLMVFGR